MATRCGIDRIANGVFVAALLFGIHAATPAQDSGVQGDEYRDGTYGRVRYQINGLTIQRGSLNHQGVADLNSPVYPGDSIVTGYDQRAEVELAGGTIVRVDRESEVTFLALPSPYANFRDNTILQVSRGILRLNALLEPDAEFRIDTPTGTVYLLGDGDFRVEVTDDGRTRAISRRGVAEVVGAGGSVLVRGGMRTTVAASSVPEPSEPFNTFGTDGFDRWVAERESAFRFNEDYGDNRYDNDAYDALPSEVQPYYRELSENGNWVNTREYGYIWQPASVGSDWRPYYDGYWDYGPNGYFWVSAEPWGWAPYRYGRWVHRPGYGWGWAPGSVFGGAWVSWSWGSLYVGWAPLGYYNYPVYYGSYYHGYYAPGCWTFVGYRNFHHHGGHHHNGHHGDYRDAHEVRDDIAGNAVRTRPPAVSPSELAESTDARQRAVRVVQADTTAAVPPVSDKPNASTPFVASEKRLRASIDDDSVRRERAAGGSVPMTIESTTPLGRPNSGTVSPTGTATRQMTSYPRRIRTDTIPPVDGRSRSSGTFRRESTQPSGKSYEGSSERVFPEYRTRRSTPETRTRTTTTDRPPSRYRTSPSAPETQRREAAPAQPQPRKSNSLGTRIRTLFGSRDKKKTSSSPSSGSARPKKTSTSRSGTRSRPTSTRSKSSSSSSGRSRSTPSARSGGSGSKPKRR